MRSLRRFLDILVIAVRELGAAAVHRVLARWPRLAERLAGPRASGPRRLRDAFESAGGAFLKLGQLLALQPDVLPLRYCNELYDLLDRVEPCAFADIEAVFAAELGRTPDRVYERFEREPLATASIGQVHVAFRNGRKYAVKVRRPGADAEFASDIRLMHAVLTLVVFLRVRAFYWLRSPITEFIEWTSEELDYRQEARYMEEIRRNSRGDPRSRVPAVDWDVTTRRTLAVEFCEGTTVLALLRSLDAGDERLLRELRQRGFEPRTAARNIIDIFLRDAFMHGLFHADLHPANLLLLPGSVIGYVDFGITGALSGTTRRRLAALTIAWSQGDLGQICEIFFLLARPATQEQMQAYRDGLAELAEDWYERVEGRERLTKSFTLVMLEMLALSHRTGIMPDRAVTRYLRSAMATDGLVKRFAPGLDVAGELEAGCRHYLTKLLVSEFFSFESVATWLALAESLPGRALRGADVAKPKPAARTARRFARSRALAASRALRLGLVGFAFAGLGTLTPAAPGRMTGLLAVELAVSAFALALSAATLVFLPEREKSGASGRSDYDGHL